MGYFDGGDVLDTATSLTDEMNVGVGVTVEPFQAVDRAQRDDGALLTEQGQVAVDRCQAQIGDLGFQLLVDPFG